MEVNLYQSGRRQNQTIRGRTLDLGVGQVPPVGPWIWTTMTWEGARQISGKLQKVMGNVSDTYFEGADKILNVKSLRLKEHKTLHPFQGLNTN